MGEKAMPCTETCSVFGVAMGGDGYGGVKRLICFKLYCCEDEIDKIASADMVQTIF